MNADMQDLVDELEELQCELSENGEDALADLVGEEVLNVKWGALETLKETLNRVADECKTLREANLCDSVLDMLDEVELR